MRLRKVFAKTQGSKTILPRRTRICSHPSRAVRQLCRSFLIFCRTLRGSCNHSLSQSPNLSGSLVKASQSSASYQNLVKNCCKVELLASHHQVYWSKGLNHGVHCFACKLPCTLSWENNPYLPTLKCRQPRARIFAICRQLNVHKVAMLKWLTSFSKIRRCFKVQVNKRPHSLH